MLNDQVKRRLEWEDGGRRPQTPQEIEALFREAGLPCFPAVAHAFARFGGGRFCLTEAIDTPHFQHERFKTKFKILYAQDALREVERIRKRHPDQFAGFDDPARFRIPFADCDRCHEAYTLNGHGQVYEAEERLAGSLEEWLAMLGQNATH